MGAAGWGSVVSPTFRSKVDERVFVVKRRRRRIPIPKKRSYSKRGREDIGEILANIIGGAKRTTVWEHCRKTSVFLS